MNERVLDLLYRSFDDELSRDENEELARALSSSIELREEKIRIEQMRQMLKTDAERSFKPFFAARVMQRIRSAQVKQEEFVSSLSWAFRFIALVGILTVVFLFAYNAMVKKDLSLDSVLAVPQLSLEDTWELDNLLEE